MKIPEEFDIIRPYTDEEFEAVMKRLLADREFAEAIDSTLGRIPRMIMFHRAAKCRNATELHKKVVTPLVVIYMAFVSKGFKADFSSIHPLGGNWTFISNHRDIVMDSALLDILLIRHGADSVEIAIGDNLLSKPWINDLVRLSRSFIVRRSLPPSEFIESSKLLSRYIQFAIGVIGHPVWIAQREGRAKDSDDRTQKSMLKMLAMSGQGCAADTLELLHIVPLAISYEYDPCDWLKAKEFQQKRDDPDFHKSREDDLVNMKTGIFGHKGHVFYRTAECIDDELAGIDRSIPRNQQLEKAAEIIDRCIHSNYRIFPCNWIALDLLNGNESGHSHYTDRQKRHFERYIARQLRRIELPDPDWAFLRTKILEMYANPLINHLKATGSNEE